MLCSLCYSRNSRLFLFGHIALEFVLRCNALRSIAKKLLQDNALKPKEKPKGNSFHLRLLCAFPLCHLSAARTTCGHFCRLSRIVYAAFPSTLPPGARHTQSTVDAFTEALKTSRNSAQICYMLARPRDLVCSEQSSHVFALAHIPMQVEWHPHMHTCKPNKDIRVLLMGTFLSK